MTSRSCQNTNLSNCRSSNFSGLHVDSATSRPCGSVCLLSHVLVDLSPRGNSRESVRSVSDTSPTGKIVLSKPLLQIYLVQKKAHAYLVLLLRKDTLQNMAIVPSSSISLRWSARLSVGTMRIPAIFSTLAAVKLGSSLKPLSFNICRAEK